MLTKARPTLNVRNSTTHSLEIMKTKNLLLAIVLLTSTAFVAHGQSATNSPPLPPAGTVSTNAVYLATQLAELKAQVTETSRLLAEYAKANAELVAALRSVQPAPQLEPAQPQPQAIPRPLYYWDGSQYVLITSGTASEPRVRQKTRGAPGPIVGIIQRPQTAKPGYLEAWKSGGRHYVVAAAPR
ncbi:MAG: hypothetical protein UY50_C0031G0004 [Parcubacteria group bacterium GW2011_GWA2_49_9]|nr:MAG: hypothetical protein UY50_C0031G0004 [Parcubacteria group bacterium GW2011_GWA2_49_9]